MPSTSLDQVRQDLASAEEVANGIASIEQPPEGRRKDGIRVNRPRRNGDGLPRMAARLAFRLTFISTSMSSAKGSLTGNNHNRLNTLSLLQNEERQAETLWQMGA